MSRKERKNEPALTPKEQQNQKYLNVPGRVALMVLAIVVAAVAFGNGIYEVIKVSAGWQEVTVTDAETYAYQEFVLSYNLGAGEQSAKADLQAISPIYTQALDDAYRALSCDEYDGVGNLYTVNSQPNTEVTVEPLLYAALETVEAAGSRWIYYAPLMEQYDAMFLCDIDEDAALFDPAKDEATAEYVQGLLPLVQDESAVRLVLLGDNTVRLEVSQAYLDYAGENEVGAFVDLGILRNAFICDAAAEALAEQGYENGVVSSADGFARNLCAEEFALNLFDWQDGAAVNVGAVRYTAPAALVSLRAFPVSDDDAYRYFVYSDGTVVTPFLGTDGTPHTAASSLTTLSTGTAAALAVRTLAAFTGEDADFAALSELSWASTQDGQVTLHGEGFALLDSE